MTTPASQSDQLFWRATDALRADGGPVELAVQTLAALFLLRLLDFEDAEAEAIALFEGREHDPILPERLKWKRLVEQGGWVSDMLMETVRYELVPFLDSPPDSVADRLAGRRAMVEALTGIPSPQVLAILVDLVDRLPFETPEDRRQAGQVLGEMVVRWAEQSRFGGEFSTPPAVAAVMAAIAGPRLGDRVYDPCFGAANGLVACVERLRSEAQFHTAADWDRVKRESIFGVELNAGMHLIGAVRLMLSGIESPGLVVGDALTREVGRGPTEGFDCIVAVPPWGRGPKDREHWLRHLPFPKASLEELFIQHIGTSLRPGGRAVVAVPDGVLFRGGTTERVRRWLVQDYKVRLVVRLPRGAFRPYTNVATSLLVFERQPPGGSLRVVDLRDHSSMNGELDEVLELCFGDASSELVTEVPLSELPSRHFEFQAPSLAEDLLDEALQSLPPDVAVRALADLVESPIRTGAHYRKSETVEDEPPETERDAYIKLVRVGDVGERLVRSPSLWARKEGLKGKWEQRVVRAGNLVITSSGTIGRVGVATNGSVGALASNSVLLVRPRETVSPTYLAAVLRSPTYQTVLQDRARGTVISHLTAKVLRSIPIPLPPLQVQQRVSDTVRDHGGDALAVLRAVLTDDGHPLPRLVEASPLIDAVLDVDDQDGDAIREVLAACVTRVGVVAREQAEALDGPEMTQWQAGAAGETDSRRLLWRWSKRLSAWLDRLRGITLDAVDLRYSAVQHSQLVSSDTAIAECLRTIPTDGTINARRARTWLERSRQLVRRLADDIASTDTNLVFVPHSEPPLEDGRRMVCVCASHDGPGVLSDLTITLTRPDGAGFVFKRSVLMPEDLAELLIPLSARPEVHGDRIRAQWTGRRLDGSRTSGDFVVDLNDMWPAEEELELGELGSSPYITGSPIDRDEMFFGRADVLNRINLQLSQDGVANIVLLEGNRRTGKTSILRRLEALQTADDWLPVYCSFQKAAGHATKQGVPTDELFRLIGLEIVQACFKAEVMLPLEGMPSKFDKRFMHFELPKLVNTYFRDVGSPFLALNSLVESAIDEVNPRRLLLMLDEFDKLQEGIKSGVTSPQTPENIRNLFQEHTSMAGILAGSRRIKRLREEYWSALFGFGYPIRLQPLCLDDARKLVTSPVRGRLRYEPKAVDAIVQACARQPYLIQMVCARMFEVAAETGNQTVTYHHARAALRTVDVGDDHFKTLWEYIGTDRRRYVLWLIHELQDGDDPVGVDLLSLRLDDASIPQQVGDGVEDDLEFLQELETVDQVEDAWKKVYRLSMPLMGWWMQNRIDPDVVRRRAVEQAQEPKE